MPARRPRRRCRELQNNTRGVGESEQTGFPLLGIRIEGVLKLYVLSWIDSPLLTSPSDSIKFARPDTDPRRLFAWKSACRSNLGNVIFGFCRSCRQARPARGVPSSPAGIFATNERPRETGRPKGVGHCPQTSFLRDEYRVLGISVMEIARPVVSGVSNCRARFVMLGEQGHSLRCQPCHSHLFDGNMSSRRYEPSSGCVRGTMRCSVLPSSA